MDNKLSVIGISRSKGSFQGYDFDNLILHCTKPADTSKEQEGQLCEIIKVKFSCLGVVPVIGDLIVPVYNRFGQVSTITVY